MFRFNNPDALLVMLLVASAYCLTRALEQAGTRWVIAAGTLIGLAFLAKMMQAFLVLPGFARRLPARGADGAPSASGAGLCRRRGDRAQRRLVGGDRGAVAGRIAPVHRRLARQQHRQPDPRLQRPRPPVRRGGPGRGRGRGELQRARRTAAALRRPRWAPRPPGCSPRRSLALGVGLWRTRRASRTDRTRAALLLWGGWLIVSALVFSLGSGVIHTYYTVALAPAIAALVAIGATSLWSRRDTLSRASPSGRRGRPHRGLGLRAAAPDARLAALAAGARARRRRVRGRPPAGCADAPCIRPADQRGDGRAGDPGVPGGAGRIHRPDRHHGSHGLDSLGRAGVRLLGPRRPGRRGRPRRLLPPGGRFGAGGGAGRSQRPRQRPGRPSAVAPRRPRVRPAPAAQGAPPARAPAARHPVAREAAVRQAVAGAPSPSTPR